MNGGVRYGIAPNVLSSVVRIVTNARVFAKPSSPGEALSFAEALMAAPDAVVVTPGPRHWSLFVELVRKAGAKGDVVADAWFAALAVEWGCTWVTLDSDYARFKQLAVLEP